MSRYRMSLDSGWESNAFEPFKEVEFKAADGKTIVYSKIVHGEWIIHRNAEISYERLITNYECSVCHTWSRYHSNYCPDCGAKMDLKEVKE